MIRKYLLHILILIIVLVSGCSDSADNPVLTDPLPNNAAVTDNGFELLGMWTISFDTEALTSTVTPSRQSEQNYDVTKNIPAPKLVVLTFDPVSNIIKVNATLKNPLKISGYDVRAIIYSNGGYELLNPDGWTDVFDIAGGDDINPFLAYCKDEPMRIFTAYSQHTETFEVYLPNGNGNVQFAVVASYPGNCDEPYAAGILTQAPIYDIKGSTGEVRIDIFDWQNDVEEVTVRIPAVTGHQTVQMVKGMGNTWVLELENGANAGIGVYEGYISARSGENEFYTKAEVTIEHKERTLGMVQYSDGTSPGYVLYQPLSVPTAFLIDNDGLLIHRFEGIGLTDSITYILENGNALMTTTTTADSGSTGGMVYEMDWDGNVVWSYTVDDTHLKRHHDVCRMPNGNTLIVAWDKKTKAEAIAAGKHPYLQTAPELWADSILEVNPAGEIVWQWTFWDHLCSVNGGVSNGRPVPTNIQDPGRLNINMTGAGGGSDWTHINAVNYNAELDQITISSPMLNEIFVIDHSTADYDDPAAGIEAATGAAGDIMYRWGNPRLYGAGTQADRKIFGAHDVQWIQPGYPGEGNIMFYNNGWNRSPAYSSIDVLVTPVNPDGTYTKPPEGTPFGPSAPDWTYPETPDTKFYSMNISGATRLPNGNTLICCGVKGWFFEINPENEIVWQYISPVTPTGMKHQGDTPGSNMVFRCYRYAPDYQGFAGRDMSPGYPVELP